MQEHKRYKHHKVLIEAAGFACYPFGVPDHLTPEKRSWNMSRVRGKDTRPERLVRSLLHRAGYRFTVNGPLNRNLPGKPDIVLPKHRAVIFVHGCFWHHHPGCHAARIPKSSSSCVDWEEKLAGNVRRDRSHARKLRKEGWKVLSVWECSLIKTPEKILLRLKKELTGPPPNCPPNQVTERDPAPRAQASEGCGADEFFPGPYEACQKNLSNLQSTMRYKVEMKYLYGWDDADWTEEYDEGSKLIRFESIHLAQSEIDDFFAKVKAAIAAGDMDTTENSTDYRIVEVGV